MFKKSIEIFVFVLIITSVFLYIYAGGTNNFMLRLYIKSGYAYDPHKYKEIRGDLCGVDCETGVINVDDIYELIELIDDNDSIIAKRAEDIIFLLGQDICGRILWSDQLNEMIIIHKHLWDSNPKSTLHFKL